MRQWKAAGPAPRDVDETLWQRFRGAQDTFFGARDAAQAEQDQEFAANAEVKEKLLVEAEALVPVTRPRGRQAGHPRHRRALGGRRQGPARPDQGARGPAAQGRAGRSAAAEDEQWRRTDPEKSARADDMVSKLEAAIADIEADLGRAPAPPATPSRSTDLEDNLASRRSFLDMAERASADYS